MTRDARAADCKRHPPEWGGGTLHITHGRFRLSNEQCAIPSNRASNGGVQYELRQDSSLEYPGRRWNPMPFGNSVTKPTQPVRMPGSAPHAGTTTEDTEEHRGRQRRCSSSSVLLCALWSKKPPTHDNVFIGWRRRPELQLVLHLACEVAALPPQIICVHLRSSAVKTFVG